MPLLQCSDTECGHRWFEKSRLAMDGDCELCGEPASAVGTDDEPPAELAWGQAPTADPAHPGHAREKARKVAREHGFVRPPVVPHAIARKLGLTVRESHALGALSARIVGDAIEVNASEPPVRQRFSVAHELGHYFLGTVHGDGDAAEREADAFAGELLVPGPLLKEALRTETDAGRLRRRFGVSRDVLRIAAETHKCSRYLTGE